jgi:hypothetical protein
VIAVAFAQSPPPNVYRSIEAGKPMRAAGELSGTISSVDYARGSFVVHANGRETRIAVVPSTAIYRGNQFATIADLHRGEHVRVTLSEVGGRLIAQMIRL